VSDALEESSGRPQLTNHARVALTLLESALLLGRYNWVEFRLFEVLGSWVANETESEARLLFDIQSRHHAWHSELFAERIPDVDGVVDPGTVTVASDEAIVELLSTLGGVPGGEEGGGGTLVRLVGLARVVLPRLVCGYGYHLSRAAAVSDGPVIRALELALRDDIEDWQAVELLVQRLIRRPHDVAVVTAHQQRLEALVVGSGPGLVSWPGQQEG
jgi:hypothetical protein